MFDQPQSPFGGAVINLQFKTGFPLTVHRTFLLRSSKLALLCDATTRSLDLRHISGGAGHILVQYLYTNGYQALEWTGTPRPDAGVVRFKIGVEVYAAARAYELDGLEELAKEQIEYEGASLHAFTVIDAVREAYPTPTQDDVWFPDYMKSRIKTAFKDPVSLMSAPFQIDFVEPMSIAKVVFRSMLEVYCEMLESLTRGAAEATDYLIDPLTPLTDVSFNDETTSLPIDDPPESVQDCVEERAVLTTTTDECDCEERSQAGTEANMNTVQTENIPDEQPLVEENAVPFSFEEHQADPEVALGFRYSFPGKDTNHQPDVSDGGRSFGDYNKPLQKQSSDLQLDLIQELGAQHQSVQHTHSSPAEISHKQEINSKPQVPPQHSPTMERNSQSWEDPLREVTPDRARSESTPERATPSPSKEGDQFWASVSKRRRERRRLGLGATVTFDLPESGPLQGESSKKGKEPMGTAPHSIQESVTGLVLELTSSLYQHQDPPLPSNKLIHGGGDFQHSLFGPNPDTNTDEIPTLVPPDPEIWGADIIKATQNDALVEEPELGAELELEQDTPEPASGSDICDTSSWGVHLSTTRKRRKRDMSLPQDTLAQDCELVESPTVTHEAVSHTASQGNAEIAPDNLDLDVVPGGTDNIPPGPELTSGASILAQDDGDLWGQTPSPISSDVPQGQSMSKKRSKKSKKSKKLKAPAEEHGAVLTEVIAERTEPGDALSFPVDGQTTSVEAKSGDNTASSLPPSQSQPKDEQEQDQDPWDFWGAKKSPSSRKSF